MVVSSTSMKLASAWSQAGSRGRQHDQKACADAEVMPRLPAFSGGRIRLRHRNKPAWAMTAVGQKRRPPR